MMYTFDIVLKDHRRWGRDSDRMPYNIVQSHLVNLVKGGDLTWSPLFGDVTQTRGFRVYGQKEQLEKIEKDIRRLARGKIKFSVTSNNIRGCTPSVATVGTMVSDKVIW